MLPVTSAKTMGIQLTLWFSELHHKGRAGVKMNKIVARTAQTNIENEITERKFL